MSDAIPHAVMAAAIRAKVVQRYSIGDCEVLPNSHGSLVKCKDLLTVIDWVNDPDDRDSILEKLDLLKEALR